MVDDRILTFVPLVSGLEPLSYATRLSSGIDLRSNYDYTIYPNQILVVGTGYACKLRSNFEGQIRSRSGLAAKYGIHVLNSPGTIDADYDQEIKVILHNASAQNYSIVKGDRIAQFVLTRVYREPLYMPKEITERIGGLGSTGNE